MKRQTWRSFVVFSIILVLALNMVCFLHFVPLVHAETTTDFDVVSDAYDGYIYAVANAIGNPAYYVLRDRADGNSSSTATIDWGQSLGDPYWEIYRSFIRFDSSTLAADVTITSAKICLYGSIEGSDLDFYTRIQKWTDGDDGIATDDFSKWDNVSYDDGNFYSTSFVVGEWNNITLSNFDVIVKAGYTDICIRSSMDINGEIPQDDFETAEDTGDGTHPPKLEITYSSVIPAEDYVDSQTDVDSHADHGTHSSFTAQKATDWTNDSLIEANTNTTAVNNAENFVDANNSDIDTHTGHGTSSNFTAQQDALIAYNDTLTEEVTGSTLSNSTSMFGWDTASTTGSNTIENTICGSKFMPASNGYVLNITAGIADTISTKKARAAIYFAENKTLIAETGELTLDIAAQSWRTFTFASQPIVYAGTNYTLAAWSFSGTGNCLLFYATGDANQGYVYSATYNSTNFPTTMVSPTLSTKKFNIYCNYTVQTSTDNYELDYEFSWTTADYDEVNEYLCIRTSTFSGTAENLGVDVWDGSWKAISTALTASAWNNISISGNLSSETIYFRFIGKIEAGDPNQNTWVIECSLIHTWSVGVNYELDLEEQFTTANFSRTSVELCVRMGAYNTTENIRLDYWNASASAWIVAVATLTTNVWNNVSVKAYTSNASVTFTVRFVGVTESGDIERSMWDKDACLLHTWDAAGAGLAVVVSQSILVPAYNALAKGLGFQSSDLIIPTSTGYFWKSLPFQVTGAIQAFASTNLAKALSFLSSGVTGFFSSMAKAFCLNFQPTVSVVPSSTNYFLKALGFQSTNTVQSFGSVTLQKALGFLTSGTSNLFASLSKASALSFQSGNSIIPSGTSYLSRALGFQSSALLVPSSVSYFGKALGFQATDMMRVFESTSMLKSVGFLSTELINIFDFSAFSKEVGFQVLEVQRAENVFPSATTYFWKAIGFQTIGTINLYDLTSVGKGLGFLTSGIMSGVSSFQNGVALMFESSGSIKLWDSSGMLKALGYQTTASTNLFATSGMSKAIGLFSSGSFQIYDYSSMLKGLSFQSANSIIPSAATTFLKGLGFQNTGSIIPTSTTSLLKGLSFQNLVGINLFDTSQFLKAIGLLTTGTIYPSGHLLSNNALAFNPTATINLFSHNLFGKEIATLFYDIVKPFETLGFWKALGFQSSEMIGMFGTNFFGKGLLFQTSQSINLFGNMQALKEQLFTILNVFNYEPIFPSATLIENKAVQFSVVGEIPKLFSSFSSNLGREFFNYDLILPLTYTSQSRGLQFGFDGVITAFTDSALGKATGFLVSGITNIYSGILKAVGLAFQPSGVFRVWDSNGVLKALGFQASGSVNVFSFNSIMNALGFQVDANVKLLDSSNMMKALGFLTTDTFKLFDSLSYSFEIWQYIPQDFYFTLTDITKMFSSLSFNMAKGFNNYNVIYPSGFLIQNKALGFNFDGLLRLFSDVSLGIEKGFSNFGTVNPFSYLTKNKALGFNAYDLLFAFDNLGMAKGIRITVFDFLNTGLIHVSDSLTMAKSVFIAFAENLFGNLNIQGLMIPIGQILLLRPGGFGIADDTYEILFGFCFVMLVVVFGYGLSRREKEDETF